MRGFFNVLQLLGEYTVLRIVHTILMSKLNCINCLTNMRASLVQLGLKGLHNYHIIQVRKSRHGEESLAVDQELLVVPLSLPLHLHLLLLFVISQLT